jgi:putative membrane protein
MIRALENGMSRKTLLLATIAAGLTISGCAASHKDPEVARATAGTTAGTTTPTVTGTPQAAITDESMLPPEDVNTQAGATAPTVIVPSVPVPETAQDMGIAAAAMPEQGSGVAVDTPMSGTMQLTSRTAKSDSRFAQEVTASSATEIALARIAVLRAQSEEVRNFARQMLVDHRKMAIAIDDFGLERGFMVSFRQSQAGESLITRLRAVPDAQFDGAYMTEMVAAHQNAVNLLETQAAGNTETAQLARNSLPIVREHLRMARALQGQV